MRDHVRKLIEEAKRPAHRTCLDRGHEPGLRLAAETIRLARLAASTHMILAARLAHETDGETGTLLAAGRDPS